MEFTSEEKCLLVDLLRNERKTINNNRIQSKKPDKDHLYLHRLTVIDLLLDKVQDNGKLVAK